MNSNNVIALNMFSGRIISIFLILSIIIASFLTFHENSFINVSVLNLPEHAAFDGTVAPVKKVPNWVQNSSSKWSASYSELSSDELIPLPEYIPLNLIKPAEGLSWTNASDVLVRNEKITYSTPYMGNYKLDGRENVGSHLAVDIKIPNGTPIYSIANGVVIKVSNQSTGFGHHIVVQHNKAPSYGQESVKTTLYSSYSHLGVISVSEGDVVVKGQKIAVSGQTGTATTPHLHFQIDTDEAPWHPYWPFTWSEAQAAGLDFFAAVNAGLGKSKALTTTVNPMKYVQKYSNGSAVNYDDAVDDDTSQEATSDSDTDDSGDAEDGIVEPVTEPIVEEIEVVEEVVVNDPPVLQLEFIVDESYVEGLKGRYSVLLRDQYGEKFKNGFLDDLIVRSDRGHFTARPAILSLRDFDSGMRAGGVLSRSDEGKDRLKIVYDGETYYSDWFEIKENTANANTDDTATVDESPTDDKVASDSDTGGETLNDEVVVKGASVELLFSDVSVDHEYFDAINYLAEKGVIQGYGDGTFKPEKTVSRTEALKFIFLGAKLKLNSGDLPFSDIDKDAWYGQYLYTAYKKGIVSGYSDNTYKPNDTVSRSEFFKILFEAMDVDLIDPVDVSFSDVGISDWFAKYAEYAKSNGVISDSVVRFNPSIGMTRGDVAYAMWRLMK